MTRPLLSLGLVLSCAALATAQPVPGGGPARPSAGSYLSILGSGGSPGVNYLGIYRPQQQLQQGILQNQQQFQQSSGALQQELNGLAVGADPNLPFTGQVARFNALAPYYSRNPITGITGRVRTGFGGNGVGGGGGGGFNSFGGSLSGRSTQGFGNAGGAGGFGGSGAGRAAPRSGGRR